MTRVYRHALEYIGNFLSNLNSAFEWPDIWDPRVYGDVITIRGTAWDNRQVDRVEWTSDRGYGGIATGTESWELADLPLKCKMNAITITAYDTSGNSSSAQWDICAFTWRK